MTNREEEIFHDLVRVLQKIDKMEKEDKIDLVSELFLQHVSAAIEDLTRLRRDDSTNF